MAKDELCPEIILRICVVLTSHTFIYSVILSNQINLVRVSVLADGPAMHTFTHLIIPCGNLSQSMYLAACFQWRKETEGPKGNLHRQ